MNKEQKNLEKFLKEKLGVYFSWNNNDLKFYLKDYIFSYPDSMQDRILNLCNYINFLESTDLI